jgi:hypothetical protein
LITWSISASVAFFFITITIVHLPLKVSYPAKSGTLGA